MKLILTSALAAGFMSLVTLSAPVMAQSDNNGSGSSGSGNTESATGGGSTGQDNTSATTASCRPLTASNRDTCCAAVNWNELVSSEDAAYCPSTGSNDTVRLGREFPATETSNDQPATDSGSSGTNDNATGTGTGNNGSGDGGSSNSNGGSSNN